LGSDVKGADEISKYFQAYWEKYQYKHSVIAGAVHSDDKSAFSFWQDQVINISYLAYIYIHIYLYLFICYIATGHTE
jgi:hypothetical protein